MALPQKDAKGRPMTYDRLKSSKKRPLRTVVIPLDDELAEQWQELEGRVAFAKLRIDTGIEDPKVKAQVLAEQAEAQAKLEAMKEDMGDAVAVFKIQGLGRKKYSALQEDPLYQVTDEQKKMAKERNGPDATLPWNTDTFPPVLIQACLLEPRLTVEQVQEMWESDDWTSAELMLLLNAALEVNEQVRNVNWGKG